MPVAGELYLAGTGSFAAEVAEWATDSGYELRGLVELIDGSRVGMLIDGLPVLGERAPASDATAVIALGGARRAHWQKLGASGWSTAAVIHPHAHVSPSAQIGEGAIVAPGVVIGAGAVIGEHALVSRGALVGHHAQVGAFASLLPGANVGGSARIAPDAVLGMGSVVVNGVAIGAGATVAAGAVVLGDVPDGIRVQGVPAREYTP